MGTKELYLPSSARTGGVALPRRVESEIMREQGELVQQLYELTDRMNEYNAQIAEIDPDTKIVMGKEGSQHPDIKPGYYHFIRLRDNTLAYIKPIQYDDGSWRDLDSSVFDLLAEDDLWNDRAQGELKRIRKQAEQARQKQIVRERQARAAEFDERWKSANNVSISVPRAV